MAKAIEIVLTEELKWAYQGLPHVIQKKFDKQLRFRASKSPAPFTQDPSVER